MECYKCKISDSVRRLQKCVPVCPVTAIFVLEDLPEKWANYTKINADYFKPAAG